MRRAFIPSFALMLSSSVFALPEDASQPILIQANAAEMNQRSDEIVYSGEVRVEQGTLRVNADRITVEYVDQKVVRIIAQGAPARYRQAIEDPQGEVEAEAATIIYRTREEQLELTGDASLEQQGNTINGDTIRYDMVAGRVEAVSGAGNSVRMVLQPPARPPR
jgi:lipopolysaccharide export system protein LptA